MVCHLCGEKEHLPYQQIPKFSSSVIDMCKGYDHQQNQKVYQKVCGTSIIELSYAVIYY